LSEIFGLPINPCNKDFNLFTKPGWEKWSEFIHFGLTSQDINNTAVPLSLKDALLSIYFPILYELRETLAGFAEAWKDIPMLARTHGQPASPTRLGKEIDVFISRIDGQSKYFGQIPPGDSAEIFAPGIVSVNGRYEYGVSFSPDLKEIYLAAKQNVKIIETLDSDITTQPPTNQKRLNEIEDKLGFRIIMTDRHHWSTVDIVKAYYGQSFVEHTFKNLKNPYHLALKPQFHWTDQKIIVHYFGCVLGYQLSAIVWRQAKLGTRFTGALDTLLDMLNNIRLGTILEESKTRGRVKATYKLEEMSDEEDAIKKLETLKNNPEQIGASQAEFWDVVGKKIILVGLIQSNFNRASLSMSNFSIFIRLF